MIPSYPLFKNLCHARNPALEKREREREREGERERERERERQREREREREIAGQSSIFVGMMQQH